MNRRSFLLGFGGLCLSVGSALKRVRALGGSATERDKDIRRKRVQRSEAAEVVIGDVADPARRAACLADPVLFLKTYGLDDQGKTLFYNQFAAHHLAMIEAIHQRAINGGDKAIAAPRGDGKSTVAIWMAIYVLLACDIRSMVIIAATRRHAKKLFKRIQRAFMRNDLLMGDFPEIGDCVRGLDGAPQRAAKQHVGGKPTNITWTQDEIVFPTVEGSKYGGVHVAYYGLDSAIRGGRFEFALIDDPETREVATGEQHFKVEEMIDKDVAGLAGPNTTISRVVLTTIQNPYCYSARVTDRKQKPTFAGDRYGMLSEWPTNTELWDEYISLRQTGQADGDKDGLEALRFYLDNREAMDAGAVVTNPDRFNRRLDENGNAVEVSALQSFFNRVADWGMDSVMSELQNDPQDDGAVETAKLSPGLVLRRVSGYERNELPPDCRVTMGLDLGDRYGHWVKVAWFGNATGVVIDYGVMEVPGMLGKNSAQTPQKVIEVAIYDALMDFHNMLIRDQNPPEFGLIDSSSGLHTAGVYSFVRDLGGNTWGPAKGDGTFRMPDKATGGKHPFKECFASYQEAEKLWLYRVHTDWWQEWVQQRFMTETFDQDLAAKGELWFNDGSLSVWKADNPRDHLSFAQHMCSHERQTKFIEGKGRVSKWIQVNKNNHWLDAIAYAAAAAGCLEITLEPKTALVPVDQRPQPKAEPEKPREAKPQKPKQQATTPSRFRSRPGGWIQGARRQR